MYQSKFGLRREAFRMTPDPSTIYLTARYREAMAGVGYAILSHKGFTVLTGDAGTGKTTLLSRVVQTLPRGKFHFSIILNSVLTPAEFLESVLIDFGLQEIPSSKAQRVVQFQRFLLNEYHAGKQCVLIVDEAQDLSVELLEELRLLSNCELPSHKLLQIVLSGQSELDALLDRQDLRQMKQRVEVRLRISALTDNEVREYVRFRWTAAGGSEPIPFNAPAMSLVTEYSAGIPRLVNTICDNSLVVAFGKGSGIVTAEHVTEAAGDLRLRRRGVIQKPIHPDAAVAAAVTAAAPITIAAFPREERPLEDRGRSRISRWAAKLGFAS
jgi:type II secretory pathway predicted ATPase ExeA